MGRRFAEVVPELDRTVWDALENVMRTGEPFVREDFYVPTIRTATAQSKTTGSMSSTTLSGSGWNSVGHGGRLQRVTTRCLPGKNWSG